MPVAASMMKRLEQVAALVVAAGLAIVSYWLFFSWAQGGGPQPRKTPRQSSLRVCVPRGVTPALGSTCPRSLETPAGLDQPLLGGAIVEAGDMGLHLFGIDGKPLGITDLHDPAQGTTGVL